jgi:hypothetical protein
MTDTATKPKKVRVGFGVWGYPDEVEPQDMQRTAVADLSAAEVYDWDGNEVEEWDETYDEYVNKRPSRADLKKYPQPVYYWEVRYPGCSIQPYPRMGAIVSTPTGLWTAHNAVQERAIREHIQIATKHDPDDLKITDHEMAVMDGKEKGGIRYCQNAGCYFVSCAMTAIDIHETLTGHRTDSRPRKDS